MKYTPEQIRAMLEAATQGPLFQRHFDDEHAMNLHVIATKPAPPGFEGRHEGSFYKFSDLDSEEIVAITLLQTPRLCDNDKFDENQLLFAAAPTIIADLLARVDELELDLELKTTLEEIEKTNDKLREDSKCSPEDLTRIIGDDND